MDFPAWIPKLHLGDKNSSGKDFRASTSTIDGWKSSCIVNQLGPYKHCTQKSKRCQIMRHQSNLAHMHTIPPLDWPVPTHQVRSAPVPKRSRSNTGSPGRLNLSWLCAAALALSLTSTFAAPVPQVFSDNVFRDEDWSLKVITVGNGGIVLAGQNTGGNPGE